MPNVRQFPCTVCSDPLEVRTTKKGKPYMICNPCGVQLFIRNSVGVSRFETLLAERLDPEIGKRLRQLKKRYTRRCPKCMKVFWTEERLLKMGGLLGDRPVGYRCPGAGCLGVAPLEAKSA